MKRLFRDLTAFERRLWVCSLWLVGGAFFLSPQRDWLNLAASLIGVTALIFVAKGYVIGQVLTVVFALFYGSISWHFRYYGEMITYLGMTAPIALMAVVSWLRHPFAETKEVAVHRVTPRESGGMVLLALFVTAVFYFILKALGTASLGFSTLSITTSFLASWLTFLRSPFYALAYAANDVVLMVLWTLAAVKDPGSIPMVACFFAFFCNDSYGFFNWRAMERRQKESALRPS